MRNQTKTYAGRLIYDDLAQYQLVSSTYSTNLSKLLHTVYYADSNYIELKITHKNKTLFNEQGNLYLKRDEDGLYGYHVDGENLELVLFDSVNKDLFLEIYADALVAGNGDCVYDRQECAK